MPSAHVQPRPSASRAYQEVGAMGLKANTEGDKCSAPPNAGATNMSPTPFTLALLKSILCLTLAHISKEGKKPLTESASQF